ncbi:sulfatase [Halococcus saccharolyticus]|uniref:Arylsulfatase A family protein n=1 Tax=Halococcus saccharolyticus DSM 5350 TaxID=1227455 RepID=M0MJA4_9EURY|nr:sulfatase [Halococcus saccharolyticus]EMA44814.1 arylsulfatase A family protein [Halococcus saccharolyticus DSM 5350]
MTDRRNVVLVTVDSLRADHCSFMGYERETTPTLDAMADDGLVFENAIAPGPSTPESMPTVMTGHDPVGGGDTGDVDELRANIRRHMETRNTLAETFRRRGYATAAFTPNPFTSRYFGFDRGFDRFEDYLDTFVRRGFRRLVSQLARESDLTFAVRMVLNMWQREEVFKPWEDYYDEVTEWTESVEEPYFVWVHLMDPHVPYLASEAYRRLRWWRMVYANYRFWRADKESAFDPALRQQLLTAYDDSIRYTDAFLDRLRADTDAVIAVHGDHGEAFGEHGIYGHEPYLYEENVHVPLVLDGVPDRTVTEPVSLAALPTMLTDASNGNDPMSFSTTDPFAVARTRAGEQTALRGRRVTVINSRTDMEMYALAAGEETPVSNPELERLCRRRLGVVSASEREREAITMAARRLVEG